MTIKTAQEEIARLKREKDVCLLAHSYQAREKSGHTDFVIGTEISIVENLQYACHGRNKRFYPLSKRLICPNMKITTLMDVLGCLRGDSGEEVVLSDETIAAARGCIDRMIELAG